MAAMQNRMRQQQHTGSNGAVQAETHQPELLHCCQYDAAASVSSSIAAVSNCKCLLQQFSLPGKVLQDSKTERCRADAHAVGTFKLQLEPICLPC